MSDESEAAFAKWQEEYGYVATEIYDQIKKSSHLLDIADGNHAKLHGEDLGILVVLPYEHVAAFAAENLMGDFERSPLHGHVFSTMTALIMGAMDALCEDD